jgi:hypothetical protein
MSNTLDLVMLARASLPIAGSPPSIPAIRAEAHDQYPFHLDRE